MSADIIAAVAALAALLGAYWARQAAKRAGAEEEKNRTAAAQQNAEGLVHAQYLWAISQLVADRYAIQSLAWGQLDRIARNDKAPGWVREDAVRVLDDGTSLALGRLRVANTTSRAVDVQSTEEADSGDDPVSR